MALLLESIDLNLCIISHFQSEIIDKLQLNVAT